MKGADAIAEILKREGMQKTQAGIPVLLEFITAKEIAYSIFK